VPGRSLPARKNEIWSARVARLAGKAAQFGVMNGKIKTDMSMVRQRKRVMVDGEVAFHLDAYKRSRTELIMATGRFIAPKTIEVESDDGGHICRRGPTLLRAAVAGS
jgi:pyruvate/2-oxoglutarate dehydrogenase complex dihydrolipoamide dehydrogenase (E3) component